MKARMAKIAGKAAPWLLAVLAALALLWVIFGWSPVLGNLVSAVQLRIYAAQVWPGLEPEGLWAWYDLKNGGYSLEFALENGDRKSTRLNSSHMA